MTTKPTVIGLFGLPGCGKSFMLDKIRADPELDQCLCYEGSEKIFSSIGPDGAEKFNAMSEEEKKQHRELAIKAIAREAADSGKTALVTGHFSFLKFPGECSFRDEGYWIEGKPFTDTDIYDLAWTEQDADIYTHIIYFALDSHTLYQRRTDDPAKKRPKFDDLELRLWQENEFSTLREICKERQILFSVLQAESLTLARIRSMISRFHDVSLGSNGSFVEQRCDELIKQKGGKLTTVLLLDGDKTISPLDTGSLFAGQVGKVKSFFLPTVAGEEDYDQPSSQPRHNLLEETMDIFRHADYSEYAFRQISLCHEEALTDEQFEAKCLAVARKTQIHPDFWNLLERVAHQEHILTVVVTAGISRIWELVLQQWSSVKVIGGGRTNIPYVVTPEAKGLIASRLRHVHGLRVWAFGDSPIDIPMLKAADHSIVIVGREESRSRSMDEALSKAIDEGLQARQLLLPETVTPRLDFERLPRVYFDPELYAAILARLKKEPKERPKEECKEPKSLTVLHATKKSSCKLLAAPSRDISICGPALQGQYSRIGQYLAMEYLADLLGLDESPIVDVQGKASTSYRLRDEACTAIVALMRAGDPLARGVHEVFPLARYIHAREASDLGHGSFEGISTILLVDTVINTGKTVLEFVRRVRRLKPGAKMVFVAGVVQSEVIAESHEMANLLAQEGVAVVAMRVSLNKYKGTRGLDTGNRMFNTTHME